MLCIIKLYARIIVKNYYFLFEKRVVRRLLNSYVYDIHIKKIKSSKHTPLYYA